MSEDVKPKGKASLEDTRLAILCKKFEKAYGTGESSFHDTARKVIAECFKIIEEEYSNKIPPYQIELCDNQKFDGLRPFGMKATAFTNHLTKIIAINLDELLSDTWGTFSINFVMCAMEEWLHASFPSCSEAQVKTMTYSLSEEYLEVIIPPSYKKRSLENAGLS